MKFPIKIGSLVSSRYLFFGFSFSFNSRNIFISILISSMAHSLFNRMFFDLHAYRNIYYILYV